MKSRKKTSLRKIKMTLNLNGTYLKTMKDHLRKNRNRKTILLMKNKMMPRLSKKSKKKRSNSHPSALTMSLLPKTKSQLTKL